MKSKKRLVNIAVFVPHLGCPHDCVFCNQRSITGNFDEMTLHKAKNIITSALLTIDKERCGVEIAFFGGSFTAVDRGFQIELLKTACKFIKSGEVGGIRISTRPDYINDEILEYLKYYGVTTIELGVQSMDDEVLGLSKRGHTSACVVYAAKLIKERGFNLILQMMPGLPGDCFKKAFNSAKKIAALSPDGVRIYPVAVLKDTELYNMYKNNLYRPLSVKKAVVWCAKIIEIFEKAGIEILRVGLMSSESLNKDTVAGGAYHESFGELCYSRLYFNKAKKQILNGGFRKNIRIFVPPGCVSKMVGHKKENTAKLKKMFNIDKIEIKEKNDIKNNIIIEPVEITKTKI